ncbi:hypothetical protein LPW26_06940 [Rhodopseudomonas sp. HC1]|nr:hypothetical protein [Rhodopseudomonas infernalis]MCG6204364.1 hypothetical protein [Rhodopseudomonas infernalis]
MARPGMTARVIDYTTSLLRSAVSTLPHSAPAGQGDRPYYSLIAFADFT